jgi:ankyrin repeat protein
MPQTRSVGFVEGLPGAESNIELDLQDSHFQLPIRHHPTTCTDGSKEHHDTGLTISELRKGYSQEPKQSLLFSDRATTIDARPGMSECEGDLLARSPDSIFELLVCGDIAMVETSLNNGLCLESLNRDGLTLLIVAIKESNIAMTELLLRNGADVHHRALGRPPLMYAVQSLRHGPQLIRLLLDRGANINTTCGSQHMNALHSAAATGMLDAVNYLIARGLGIESTCARAHTPLHVAAGTGQLKVARLLLAQGAQLSLKSELGGNALVFAACNGHLDLVKLFLEEGLAVDDCDKTGLSEYLTAVVIVDS